MMDKGTAKCIFGAWKNAFGFVGPLNLMALGDGQRNCKMHSRVLENAFWVPGKYILPCGASQLEGPGRWIKDLALETLSPKP